jgi:hypothetical protein
MKDGYLDLDHLKVGCDLDLGFGVDQGGVGHKVGSLEDGTRTSSRVDLGTVDLETKGFGGGGGGG